MADVSKFKIGNVTVGVKDQVARDSIVEVESNLTSDLNNSVNGLENEIEVERARITSLATLSEGSTTGDAELIDIRTGANGVTYPSAGDAVRSQFDIITNKNQSVSSLCGLSWTLNRYIGLDGLLKTGSGNERIATAQFIPVIPNSTISIRLETGHANINAVAFYTGPVQTTFISGQHNIGTNGNLFTVTVPANANYARFSSRVEINTLVDFGTSPLPSMYADIKDIKTKTDVAYVSPLGVNASGRGTKLLPFATIRYAVQQGFKNICLARGDYFYTGSSYELIENTDNLNIYADNDDSFSSDYRQEVRLINGSQMDLSTITSMGSNVYRISYTTSQTSWSNVFINQSVDPMMSIGSGRTAPAVGLWLQHDDYREDFELTPVLSNVSMPNNTFYYDGTYIYICTDDYANMTGLFIVGDVNPLRIRNCDNVTLSDITVMYGVYDNFEISNCSNVVVNNCKSMFTSRSHGFMCDYSDIIFNNCESYKAMIDGYNTHNYGVTVLNNCKGNYNYDDGQSSHEYCEVVINGGEYAFNGKAGVAPVHLVKLSMNGVWSHDNVYGLFMTAGTYSPTFREKAIITGCAFKGNTTDIRLQKGVLCSVLSVYSTTDVTDGGQIVTVN